MATRRGINSLIDKSLPQCAVLSPEVIHSAIKGLMVLRELELNETYCLVLSSGTSCPCSSLNCLSHNITGPRVSDTDKKVINQITCSSPSDGTKVLQVLLSSSLCEGNSNGFCESGVKGWEVGHAEVRKRAWNALLGAFGLRG